jgi:hypothetical protein
MDQPEPVGADHHADGQEQHQARHAQAAGDE